MLKTLHIALKVKLAIATVLLSLGLIPALSALEANLIDVTATIAMLDEPVFIPVASEEISPGTKVFIMAPDADVTHIYFTYTENTTDLSVVPDPVCGGSNGGDKNDVVGLVINVNTAIKAISCSGASPDAGFSPISTQVYAFEVVAPVVEAELDTTPINDVE